MAKIKTNIKDRSSIEEIKIFGTEYGVNVIESPIKTRILSLLKSNKGLNGSDIVLLTGKSKSTISAHLKDLINEGIVDYKPDSVDGRRKIFYIKSRYLGNLSRESELEKDMDDYLQEQVINSGDPFKFFKYILRSIRVSLMIEGVNIDPILHNAGLKVGKTFEPQLETPLTDEFLQNLSHFWESNKLGRVEVESLNPLTIRIYDCFECEDLPIIGRSACAFDSGILTTLFSSHFHQDMEVFEVMCYAKGDDYCCFEIKPLEYF
ncbi:MAG TPA: V4R domain-containing protein [Methanobacterium sp.]|nr:V4R domain-containing protein [Methanobacterium sp.]